MCWSCSPNIVKISPCLTKLQLACWRVIWEIGLYCVCLPVRLPVRLHVVVCVGLSAQELSGENDELTEQIKELRRRAAMLRILIEELEQSYEESKRFVVVQRYRLIKSMIKRVTQSSLI